MGMMKVEYRNHLRIEIPCSREAVTPARERVVQWLESQGVDKITVQEVQQAVAEALNNAVDYVLEKNRGLPVVLEVHIGREDIWIFVWDHTGGFEPPEQPPPFPSLDQEHGRGLPIIWRVCDQVRYLRSKKGNLLLMYKRRMRVAPLPVSSDPKQNRQIEKDRKDMEGFIQEIQRLYEVFYWIFHAGNLWIPPHEVDKGLQRIVRGMAHLIGASAVILRLAQCRPNSSAEHEGVELKAVAYYPETIGPLLPVPVPISWEELSQRRGYESSQEEGEDQFHSVEAAALVTGMDRWIGWGEDLPSDEPLRKILSFAHAVVHPFQATEGECYGTITIVRQDPENAFTAFDVNVVNMVTEFVATQIANIRLAERRTQAQLMEHELDIAAQVQQSMLPQQRQVEYGDVEVRGVCRSARKTGGDFYDFIELPDGRVLIAVADVMGKGVSAAFLAVVLRTALRTLARSIERPDEILGELNRVLAPDFIHAERYATVGLVLLEPSSSQQRGKGAQIYVALAGHPPPVLWRQKEERIEWIGKPGLPIGVLSEASYSLMSVSLDPGDACVLYTDGITEAHRPLSKSEEGAAGEREQFGEERLAEALRDTASQAGSAGTIAMFLLSAVDAFTENAPQEDDQTFVVIYRCQQ